MTAADELFQQLADVLRDNSGNKYVAKDVPGNLYLEWSDVDSKGKRKFFGAVQSKKSYVAFHLMPLYEQPQLLSDVSKELEKKMQGKSCFNFKKPDDALFKELANLVKRVS